MSHFAVLVITPDKPDQDELARILQPWHEYECTGVKDQYVVEVDVTDEVIKEFNKPRDVVVVPGYTKDYVYSRWDDRFYTKEPTEKSIFSRKEFELPAGAELKTMSADEARTHGVGYKTMAECAKENFGEVIERDGKFYDLTNQNKKWDWWQIGGRWTGLLVPNYDPDKDPDNIETCKLCGGTGIRLDYPTTDILGTKPGEFSRLNELGRQIVRGTKYDPNNETHKELKCNGCNGEGKHAKWPTSRKRIVGDQMRVGDIPLITLRDEAERKALAEYDKAHAIIAGRPVPVWDPVEGEDIKAARDAYWDNPVMKDLQKAGFWMLDGFEHFNKSRNQFAIDARANAICTFAVVKDGKWYERGEMGWWAIVSKAKEKEVWTTKFAKLLDNLPPDNWVTVVDMHI